ncbi:MAG TPA: C4-type zinc ribbon domain-containing protein [Anaerolineales bacterium]
MSAALGLFRLQNVDRQMDAAQARANAILQVLENDAELRAVLGRIEAAQAEKHAARQILLDAEASVKGQQQKILEAENSLYGGSVRNPKELQDLQTDVAALKRHLGTLEERQLEGMMQTESAEAVLVAAQADLEKLNARVGDEHRTLLEEQAGLTKDLQRLAAERQAVLSAIAAQALQTYEDLRQRRRGTAVAEVNENSCSACGTTLAAALQQNARSATQMAYCPSCGRILFAN